MRGIFICLIITGFAVFVCSCQTPQEPETRFFRDFALGQMVERMKMPELKLSDVGSGGTTSSGDLTQRRRDFSLTIRIEEQEGTKFDGASFINKLKDEISREMRAADVSVEGGGTSDDDSFHFDYSKVGHVGWLEVIGVRVEGNIYRLLCVIRESARKQ